MHVRFFPDRCSSVLFSPSETGILSIAVLHNSDLIGFSTFLDYPLNAGEGGPTQSSWEDWVSSNYPMEFLVWPCSWLNSVNYHVGGTQPANTVWLAFAHARDRATTPATRSPSTFDARQQTPPASEVLGHMIRSLFETLPHLDHVLFLAPGGIALDRELPDLAQYFIQVCKVQLPWHSTITQEEKATGMGGGWMGGWRALGRGRRRQKLHGGGAYTRIVFILSSFPLFVAPISWAPTVRYSPVPLRSRRASPQLETREQPTADRPVLWVCRREYISTTLLVRPAQVEGRSGAAVLPRLTCLLAPPPPPAPRFVFEKADRGSNEANYYNLDQHVHVLNLWWLLWRVAEFVRLVRETNQTHETLSSHPSTPVLCLLTDHDDLVPIFREQSDALTERYGEFYLAELIQNQTDTDKTLVAEVCRGLISSRGLRCARYEVSLTPITMLLWSGTTQLRAHHTLVIALARVARARPIEAFAPPLVCVCVCSGGRQGGRPDAPDGARRSAGPPALLRARALRQPPARASPRRPRCHPSVLLPASPPFPSSFPSSGYSHLCPPAFGLLPRSSSPSRRAPPYFGGFPLSTQPSRRRLGHMTSKHTPPTSHPMPPLPPSPLSGAAQPNAFCITKFCLDYAYEARSADFLRATFDLFPNMDFCLLTLPHTIPEFALLHSFIQVGLNTPPPVWP